MSELKLFERRADHTLINPSEALVGICAPAINWNPARNPSGTLEPCDVRGFLQRRVKAREVEADDVPVEFVSLIACEETRNLCTAKRSPSRRFCISRKPNPGHPLG